ncbi:MAG: putative toxin-antitoxin system toxin component, PIN family protein [Chloroflexota bacterium]|nr:putative toxin-antitoxin system toxin component, PIN family [Chloroflexota bacterium]GIK66246.1 MAG: putative toxin-antitoxin system toxin component, PIN family protein [Chloroflexota bacterium]
MIRAVLDTNVIVSGLLWGGLPSLVFQAARDELFVAILTESLLSETINVLARDKFAEQLAARQINLESLAMQYRAAAEIVEPAEVPTGIVRDPKDVMILACAVGGKADFIVSGDKDLLTLVSYEQIPILTAEQFLDRLSNP